MQTRSRKKNQTQAAPTAPTAPAAPATHETPTKPEPQATTSAETTDMDKALKLALNSTIRLSSGALMPRLGFGVYQSRGDECRDAVTVAVDSGYRHIDSAQAYHNEHHVAAGIAASSVPRKDLFLTTKFMPGHSVPSEEEVYAHLRKSIAKLDPNKVKKAGGKRKAEDADGGGEGNGSGLAGEEGYIDLFLIHAPRPNAAARAVHWAALARAQKEGWVRDIGVSNFGVAHLTALPGPTPAINQIELHPFCQQKDIVDYCREKGIVVQAYCPLVRAKPQHMENPVLVGVAKKHGKEVVHVLIRWSLQKGFIPLPKSVTPARIKSNLQVYDFELDDDDMARIDALDEGKKGAVSWNPVDHE